MDDPALDPEKQKRNLKPFISFPSRPSPSSLIFSRPSRRRPEMNHGDRDHVRVTTWYKDPDGEIENSGKSIFETRIPNFCYIQVIVFHFSYLPVAAVGNWASTLPWKNCEKHHLYFSEVLDSDFKNSFSGIFNFTVGILVTFSALSIVNWL